MTNKQMTAEQKLEQVIGILDYYMNDSWSGYRELLSISNGEGGCFNNDWEAEAFYTCQRLIDLLGLEPPESEEESEEVEVEYEEEDDNNEMIIMNSFKDIFINNTKAECVAAFYEILEARENEYPNGVDFYSDNGGIDVKEYPTLASYVFPNLLLNATMNIFRYLGVESLQQMLDVVNEESGREVEDFYTIDDLSETVGKTYEILSHYLFDTQINKRQLGDFRIMPIVCGNPKMQSVTFLFKDERLELSLYEEGDGALLCSLRLDGEDVVEVKYSKEGE